MMYIILFIVISIASYLYYKIAGKLNIVDKPNHRSSHTKVSIRGGGIIFYIAIILFFIISGWQYSYFFISASMLAIVSFIDDLKPLPPSYRLPIQFIAVVLILFQLQIYMNVLYYIPILVVSIGFINAFNFMDGINGITGAYTLSILTVLIFFNIYKVHFIDNDLLVFLLFSIVIFLFYNFRKSALFFAGDVGSITLGICILYFVLKLFFATNAFVVILLVAVYGVDSVLTIIRRIKMKERITDAHRHHLYQKMVDSKRFSHLQTATIYASVQLFFAFIFIISYTFGIYYQWAIVISSLLFLTVIYFRSTRYFSNKINSLNCPI